MLLIASCPICHQQLELPFTFSDVATEEEEEYLSVKTLPCNHLYNYSDGLFYQHSFIIKVDREGKIYPTPFFGEKVSKSKPALYNSYLRPVVSLQDLYKKVESLASELSFYKDQTLSLQSELNVTNSLTSPTNSDKELVINQEELQHIIRMDQLENDNELLQNDYVNLAMNNQQWYMELEDLRKKIKEAENPNEELKLQYELLTQQYSQLKDDYLTLEGRNEQLYQQLLEVQITSMVQVNDSDQQSRHEYLPLPDLQDQSHNLLEQMLHNELLIITEQKSVYEKEITRLSNLLENNEKQIKKLKTTDGSKSNLQTKNLFYEEKFSDYGKKLDELVQQLNDTPKEEILSHYLKILQNRISNLENLYLEFVNKVKTDINQHRKVMNLPEIPDYHPTLYIPKSELDSLQKKVTELLAKQSIEKKKVMDTDQRPDPNIFYKKVTNNEWNYSKDDQLIFMKALFRLKSFMMNTAKELVVDEQLKEFMKFFKNLKERSNNVIQALNNLVTNNENAFSKVPGFMQDYLLKYVGKISEIDLEKEMFSSEELRLLSYSFMLGEIPVMEEEEEEEKKKKTDKNPIRESKKVEKRPRKRRKTPRQREDSPRIQLNTSKKTLNLTDMKIDDLV
jgi:hypothetical protein